MNILLVQITKQHSYDDEMKAAGAPGATSLGPENAGLGEFFKFDNKFKLLHSERREFQGQRDSRDGNFVWWA